jgi:hypothetical protein
MKNSRMLLPIAAAVALTSCSSTSSSPTAGAQGSPKPTTTATTPAAPNIVGRWTRTVTCRQLVSALDRAGLHSLTPYAWVGQTSSHGQSSFKPNSPTPTLARPCAGAIPRVHSHFFTAAGAFGSLDWLGGQVDDGTYTVKGATLTIGHVTFHYRIVSGNSLHLSPVLTKTMIRAALAHPAKFSDAGWAISVAYPGLTWSRANCDNC